jgi:hypothetical protein
LAARCRERLANDPTALTPAADAVQTDPLAIVDTAEAETAVPQEDIEAAAT